MHDSTQNKIDQNYNVSTDPCEVEISDTDDFFDSEKIKILENTTEIPKKEKQMRKKCPKCPKLFYKAHLKRHIKSAHAYKRTFSCTLYSCGKGFTTKKKLEQHIIFDHEENINVPGDKTCPYCKTEFKSTVEYKYHVQRNHTHYCEECPLRFAKKKKLEEHVLNVHQKDIRLDKTCHTCGAVQRGLTDYYRHIAYDHSWECEHCNYRFAQKQKLEEHVLSVHNLDIKVDKTCQLCKQQIRSLSDFKAHILRDHKHVCQLEDCDLRFACKAKLEEHCLEVHETNIKVDRTCPHCQNVIRGLNDFFRHVEKDHKFECHLCSLKFAYKMKFEEHLLQVHDENLLVDKTCGLCLTTLHSLPEYSEHIRLEHKYTCTSCHLKFVCSATLEQHSLAEHGQTCPLPSTDTLTCQLCFLPFTTVIKMSQHQQMNHKFVCLEQLCNARFVSRVRLEEHTENAHSKSLEHMKHNMCLICEQRFTRPENLRKHRKRPHVYQCEQCVKSFTAPDRLEQHSVTEHQMGIPVAQSIPHPHEPWKVCNLCDKSFKKPYILRNHMEKDHKYPCTVCDRRYTMKHVLREHMKTVHNLESEVMNIVESDQTQMNNKFMLQVCQEKAFFGKARMIPPLISIDSIYNSFNFVENHESDEEEEEEIDSPFDEEDFDQIDTNYDCFTQALLEPQVEIEEPPN